MSEVEKALQIRSEDYLGVYEGIRCKGGMMAEKRGRGRPPTRRYIEEGDLVKAGLNREGLEKNLDKVFANYIRKKFQYTCPITGAIRHTSISHLFGQAEYPNVKWDEYNAVVMSNQVHEHYHTQNPFVYINWFIEYYGQEELDALKKRAMSRKKTKTVEELINLTNYYVKKTKALPKCQYVRKD